MRRAFLLILVMTSFTAAAVEPSHLSFVVHGRSPLEPQRTGDALTAMIETVLFDGEPVIATLMATDAGGPAATAWVKAVQWEVLAGSGEAVSPPPAIDAAPAVARHPLRGDAVHVNFTFSGLGPGRYTLRPFWRDPATGKKITSEARLLTIYRGDENLTVKRAYLREQARVALARGTEEDYRAARTMLLEAADGNTDPSVYEALADASAPWASPDETAGYYERSLAVATTNLERKFGREQREWPVKATALFGARQRKVAAFRELLPYYRRNFNDVRVVVIRDRNKDKFAVERRRDGKRLRVVEPR